MWGKWGARWGGIVVLGWAAAAGAQEAKPPEPLKMSADLTNITELERLREYVIELQKDRQGKDSDISTYRAYIRKLEGKIVELELRLGLEERVKRDQGAEIRQGANP